MTSSERHQQIKELFLQAMELAPGERRQFLNEACVGDDELRAELDALVAANEAIDEPFLQPPKADMAQDLLGAGDAQPGDQQSGEDGGLFSLLKPGDTIGPYRLLKALGEGGFGDVYLVMQEEPIRRQVALKIIKLGMDTRHVVARFKAEQQALALMEHPNIAKVHDAGATPQGRPYFVMEYVDGLPMTKFCNQERLSIRERLLLFLRVCDAIQHAHLKGVIHRDLKPSNVLVTYVDGEAMPKVIDFGIAKAVGQQLTEQTILTQNEQILGTPGYMSPEQTNLSSLDIDTRTDIYSLGIILYELLVGELPFDRDLLENAGFEEVRRAIREEEPPRPSTRLRTLDNVASITQARRTDPVGLSRQIRGDLDWIVMRAMEKDRDRRYTTASELAADVTRHLNDEPVLAGPPTAAYRLKKLLKRHRAQIKVAAALIFMLAAAIAIGTSFYLRAIDVSEETRTDRYASSGVLAAERDNPVEAVLWFANAASVARNDSPREAANRIRVRMWSRECPVPIAAFLHPSDSLKKVAFHATDRYLMALGSDGACVIRDIENDASLPLPEGRRAISAAAWSPDGDTLVLGAYDGSVGVFTFPGNERSHNFLVPGAINALEFSADGRYLFVASDNVTVWDCAASAVHAELQHPRTVDGLSVNPSGRLLATACVDGTARLFDLSDADVPMVPILGPVQNGLVERRGARGGPKPFKPVFVDNGRGLLTLTSPKSLSLWSLDTLQQKERELETTETVRSVVPSPSGRYFAVCGTSAQLWVASTGELVGRPLDHTSGVSAAAFSPQGEMMITGGYDSLVRFWSVPGGETTAPRLDHQLNVVDVVFSEHGDLFATAQEDQVIRVWQLPRGVPEMCRIPFEANANESLAVLSADGRYIMPAGWNWERRPKSTRVYELPTGSSVGAVLETRGFINGAVFSPRDNEVVTLSSDATSKTAEGLSHWRLDQRPGWVQFWDWRSGKRILDDLKTTSEPLGATFDGTGKRLAVVCAAGELYYIDAENGRVEKSLRCAERAAPGKMSRDFVVYSQTTNNFVIWGLGKEVTVWDAASGKLRYPALQLADSVSNANLSADERLLVTASWSKLAKVWDLTTGKRLSQPLRHADAVFNARFSPDGRYVLTACRDATATLWDWRAGEMLHQFRHEGEVFDASFSADGQWILTATQKDRFVAWDRQSGLALTPRWSLGAACCQILVTPDGNYAAIGGKTRSLRVFDLKEMFAVGTSAGVDRELRTLAEILSGRAIHSGGNVANLTSAEWLERWKSFRPGNSRFFSLTEPRDREWTKFLRVIEKLKSTAEYLEAERRILTRSRTDTSHATALLERWFTLSVVDMRRKPEEVLALLPVPLETLAGERGLTEVAASIAAGQPSSEHMDLRWILSQLANGKVVRINCGGSEYRGRDDRVWSPDRFFAYGFLYRSFDTYVEESDLTTFRGEIMRTEDDGLYQTERWFPNDRYVGQASYRIPLTPGSYRVVLHFAEIFQQQRGRRVFDVILEEELRLSNFDTTEQGFATALEKSFDVEVLDGFLQLTLVPRVGSPQISAIEIEPVGSAR